MEESHESLKERIRQLEDENRLLRLQLQRFLNEEPLPSPKTKNVNSCQQTPSAQFSTYKKRQGTSDVGKEYEYMMCALYAIKLATNDEVVDFEMTTNETIYGDFDDISLKLTLNDNTTKHSLLQLKHKEDAKKHLTDTDFSSLNGDFGLVKYLTSFDKIEVGDAALILYTNCHTKKKNGYEFTIQPEPKEDKMLLVRVKEYEEESLDLLSSLPGKKIFQFEVAQDRTQFKKVSQFSNQFYFFPDQMNIHNVRLSVRQMLVALLQQDIYDLFVGFVRSWWLGRFVLTKHDVVAKIAEMALKPWLRTLSSERVNQKSELLTKTMMEFQMTVVQESEDDIIDKIWAEVSEEREIIDKAAKKYDVCGEENQALWYLGRLPLIVTVDDDNSGKVECAVHLLGRCAGDKKVILVGTVTGDDFPEWRIFETLADMLTTYDEVVTTFNVSLQGRAPIPLQRLIRCDKELKDIVTVKELLEMAQNEHLSIGSLPITNLPEVYIPRVVSSPEEELSSIKEEEIFKYFNDNLNIFCAPPGMGKEDGLR